MPSLLKIFSLALMILLAGISSISAYSDPAPINTEENSYVNLFLIPVCDKPINANLYKPNNYQYIIHLSESAIMDSFYYEISYENVSSLKGRNSINDVLQTGAIYIINSNIIGDYIESVRVRRVCIFGDEKSLFYSDWFVLGNSNQRNLLEGFDCELQNGAAFIQINGEWYIDLSAFRRYFSEIDFRLQYIDDREILVQTTISGIDSTGLVNLNELLDFEGDEFPFNSIDLNIFWNFQDGSYQDSCEWITILNNEGFDLSCEEGEELTPSTSQNPLQSLQVDNVFFINTGFPVKVTSVSGSNGNYSGEGELSIPFCDKKLIVEYNCFINDDFWATTGEVKEKTGGGFQIPTGQITIGSASCYKAENEWDENGKHNVTGEYWDPAGFGQNGQFILEPPYPGYEEGMPYDPNYDPCGFDVNGNFLDTGSPYNFEGCSRGGATESGQICDPCGDPYYWLSEDQPINEEGLLLAQMYSDSIIPLITSYLNQIKSENQDSLTHYTSCITTKKGQVLTLSNANNLNPTFMFGDNNQYISEGCSKLFLKQPEKMVTNDYRRDSVIIQIEEIHIDIYNCDLLREVFFIRDSLITNQLLSSQLDTSKLEVLYLLRRLDQVEIDKIQNDPSYFMTWIQSFINSKLQNLYDGIYIPGPFDPADENNLNNDENNQINALSDENLQDEILTPSPENVYTKTDTKGEELLTFQAFDSTISRAGTSYFKTYGRNYTDQELTALSLSKTAKINSLNALHSRSSTQSTLSPIIISKAIAGVTYSIILNNFVITPNTAKLDAYAVIDDPGTGNKIAFSATDLIFGPNGFDTDEVTVNLESDIEIRLINPATLRILGGPGTYVKFNCAGYLSAGVEGEIEFCRNYMIPADENLAPIEEDTAVVKAQFAVEGMQNWGDFMVSSVSIDPFIVVDAPGLVWTVENAVLDFSDKTSPEILFPENYNSPLVLDGYPLPFWKGFYLQTLKVDITENFGDGNMEPLSLSVADMIIDDVGFTGKFGIGGNILSLSDGRLGGWAFSIDTIGIHIVANRLTGGGFGGLIHVPLFETNPSTNEPDINDCMQYLAFYQSDHSIEFAIQPLSQYKASIWKADVLLTNAEIHGRISSGDVELVAKICGELTIDAGSEALNAKIPKLYFNDVGIMNKHPYIKYGVWEVPVSGSDATVGNISFGLQNLGLGQDTGDQDKMALFFKAGVELGVDSIVISASGEFRMIGEVIQTNGRQRFIYSDFKLDEFFIDTEIKGVLKIKGQLQIFENDSIFGKGFYGRLEATLPRIGNTTISAMAIFGTHNEGYRYFMVDLALESEYGIPLGPAVSITGLGGGLYYKMKRQDVEFSLPEKYNLSDEPDSYPLGTSLSGLVYEPNNTVFIGFKATVAIAAEGSEKAFNANATLEFSFLSTGPNNDRIGGLREIVIMGNASFMEIPDKTKLPNFPGIEEATASKPPGVVAAGLFIKMDFENHVFQGDLLVYLDAGVVIGAGANKLMGKASIYFGPGDWYVHIGTPTNKLGISLVIPGVGSIGKVEAYFAMGTQVPDIPPLPSVFAEFNSQIAAMNRVRSTGRGIAFGASLEINTGELKFLMFYAQFAMGMGFDVMMKDYGNEICASTGNQIGINGWYATGQIWAYVEGDIGILWKNKKYSIISLGASAALQAQMPNPFYARGTVGGHYRILFGLIKGQCRFNFEIGQPCNPGSSLDDADMEIILATYPDEGTEQFNTIEDLSIDLIVPVNRIYSDSKKVVLKKAEVKSVDGYTVSTSVLFENDDHTIVIKPTFLLPPDTELQLIYVFDLFTGNTKTNTITDTINFTTGPLPQTFDVNNIEYTYPINGMYNYYKEEYSRQKGFIQLFKSQQYLFNESGGSTPFLRLMNPDSTVVILPFEWKTTTLLEFDLPSHKLQNGQFYEIQLVKKENINVPIDPSPGQVLDVFPAVTLQPSPAYDNVGGDLAEVHTQDVILYNMSFRVSNYNKLKDKMDFFFDQGNMPRNNNQELISLHIADMEPFENLEVKMSGLNEPLIKIEAYIQKSNQLRYCEYFNCLHETILYSQPYIVADSIIFSSTCDFADCTRMINENIYFGSGFKGRDSKQILELFSSNSFSGITTSLRYSGIIDTRLAIRSIKDAVEMAASASNSNIFNENDFPLYDLAWEFGIMLDLLNQFDDTKPLCLDNQCFTKMNINYILPSGVRTSSFEKTLY